MVYVPAKNVSGDLYFMKRISETQSVGIIGDISGKRIKCRHDFVAAILMGVT